MLMMDDMKQLVKQMLKKAGWVGTIAAFFLIVVFILLPILYVFRLLLRDALDWLMK